MTTVTETPRSMHAAPTMNVFERYLAVRVPVMLLMVRVANRSRDWYERRLSTH